MSTINSIPNIKRRAWAEISLNNAEHNFRAIKEKVNSKICCVIKANAYGHGAVELAKLYERLGADFFAVSNIEEALQLRNNGISLPILVLGYTSAECAEVLAKNDIIQCVFSYEYGLSLAKVAREKKVKVKIHIKLDTGMGRIGFVCRDGNDEINKIAEICKLDSLEAEGVFMHFAVADEGVDGEKFTREQFNNFSEITEQLSKLGVEFKIKHCANSAAVFDYPEYHLDMVRAGVVLYGLQPSEKIKNKTDLKPVMSLNSVISHIKTVEKGQTVSYGRTYKADTSTKIATVPIGYADGFRRSNGQGKYSLSVNGKMAQIVGRICMDQLMIDVTNIDCKIGDKVLIFGENQPFTADRLAKINNTINYEIVCDVGERVPRAFVENGKIISWKDDIIGE